VWYIVRRELVWVDMQSDRENKPAKYYDTSHRSAAAWSALQCVVLCIVCVRWCLFSSVDCVSVSLAAGGVKKKATGPAGDEPENKRPK